MGTGSTCLAVLRLWSIIAAHAKLSVTLSPNGITIHTIHSSHPDPGSSFCGLDKQEPRLWRDCSRTIISYPLMGFCLRLHRQILSSATELHRIRTGSPLSPCANKFSNNNSRSGSRTLSRINTRMYKYTHIGGWASSSNAPGLSGSQHRIHVGQEPPVW